MNIVVSGASGLVGRNLTRALRADLHDVYTYGRVRPSGLPAGVGFWHWDVTASEPPREPLGLADAVIHLAGEPIAQRWTDRAKKRIRDSRVLGTRHLVSAVARLERRPHTLICSSAIGYYGERGEEVLTEDSSAGVGYLAEVCRAWETEAMQAAKLGVRVVLVRTGVALHPSGGALKKMLLPFTLGLGGRLGSGRQWMSWIHLEDLIQLFRFLLDTPALAGPVNAVSPTPVTNAEFTRRLASALRRPAAIPVSEFVLRTLMGEMSSVLLASQRVLPRAATNAGFEFVFPRLEMALLDLLSERY